MKLIVDTNVLVRAITEDDGRQSEIAHEGGWFGAEAFLSFDRKAAALSTARGEAVRLLA